MAKKLFDDYNFLFENLPHFIVRGAEDPSVPHDVVRRYIDVLKAAGQTVKYMQVEGLGHAFFDWKPDPGTRSTFAKYGVKYAAEMQAFFNNVFYKG
jgi:acetyl esterase